MADNLYETGAPKRIIVEHRHVHDVSISVRRPEASWCDLNPAKQCIAGPHPFPEACEVCPYKGQTSGPSRVTITPEFQPVEERKRLK